MSGRFWYSKNHHRWDRKESRDIGGPKVIFQESVISLWQCRCLTPRLNVNSLLPVPSALLGWDINDREVVLRIKVNTNHLWLVEISKPQGLQWGQDGVMQTCGRSCCRGLVGCGWAVGTQSRPRASNSTMRAWDISLPVKDNQNVVFSLSPSRVTASPP